MSDGWAQKQTEREFDAGRIDLALFAFSQIVVDGPAETISLD